LPHEGVFTHAIAPFAWAENQRHPPDDTA
jgi:hypothetical protein